jgi:hypothetical protein
MSGRGQNVKVQFEEATRDLIDYVMINLDVEENEQKLSTWGYGILVEHGSRVFRRTDGRVPVLYYWEFGRVLRRRVMDPAAIELHA